MLMLSFFFAGAVEVGVELEDPSLLLLLYSLGLQTRPPWQGNGHGNYPCHCPSSAATMHFNAPTFRCTDVWISRAF